MYELCRDIVIIFRQMSNKKGFSTHPNTYKYTKKTSNSFLGKSSYEIDPSLHGKL
jgi:hypothetical protein